MLEATDESDVCQENDLQEESIAKPRKRRTMKRAVKHSGLGLDLMTNLRRTQAHNQFWKADKSDRLEVVGTSKIMPPNERVFNVETCITGWG